ncbi:hypothetical protein KJ980_01700 [Patescibacteria group bacterium]|nr:hypothetical protein [Patescibacteria group bacterium]MBU4016889.1 hypothetical protein [Patescibacteria group bacterium]MBU4098342.1 hypothetical protein [Patescibacteria group bacterium]
MTNEEKQKEIIEIVKARLSILPADAVLSMGSFGEFKKDQIINEVENNTDVGKKVVEVQMEYLQMLKKGIFYGESSSYQTTL